MTHVGGLDLVQDVFDRMQNNMQAIADSLQRVQEMNEQDARHHIIQQNRISASLDKLQKGTLSLHSYHKSMCDAPEVPVTSIVRMHLKDRASEVYELPRPMCQIPAFPPSYDRGVEWDGVLYLPAIKHLYLIEAKSNLENKHISGMPKRIERTMQFMRLCAERELPPNNASYYQTRLCSDWAGLSAADQVFGVVGAPGFTSEMLATANCMGLMAVFFNSGAYHCKLPLSGTLLCHKTGQPVSAISGAEITEEDMEYRLALEAVD